MASTRLVASTRTFPPMLTRFVRFVLRHILEASGQEAGIEVTLTASTLVVTNFEVCARRGAHRRTSSHACVRAEQISVRAVAPLLRPFGWDPVELACSTITFARS